MISSSLCHGTDSWSNQTVRHVKMLEGVTVVESTAQKDELILVGNDIDHVSQSGSSLVLFADLPLSDIS